MYFLSLQPPFIFMNAVMPSQIRILFTVFSVNAPKKQKKKKIDKIIEVNGNPKIYLQYKA